MISVGMRLQQSMGLVLLALGIPLLAAGCIRYVGITACTDARPSSGRVNLKGDDNEAIATAQSVADVGNGHVMVVFVAQSIAADSGGYPLTSVVRLAIIDVASGMNVVICNEPLQEEDLSAAGVLAYGASLARAPIQIPVESGPSVMAAALVSWTEGTGVNTQVRAVFLDSAGCPMAGGEFTPYSAPGGPIALSWSEQSQAVLAMMSDGQRVFTALITEPGPAPFTPIATSIGGTGSSAASAIAADGTAMLAWNDVAVGTRAAILDASGTVENAGADGHGLDPGFPQNSYNGGGPSIVRVAARARGFAVFQDAAENSTTLNAAYVRNFDLTGTPIGAAWRLDPGDSETEQEPSGVFLREDLLLAAWQSTKAGSTVAGLFGLDGSPRFNAVSCKEGSFVLGPAAGFLFDTQAPVVADGTLLVFYTGKVVNDSLGTGVGRWQIPVSQLWPAQP